MANRRNAFYSLLIFCLVMGVISGRTFFFNLAYAIAALLIGSFVWSWAAVNWLAISRTTYARRAQVGRTLDEAFSIRNTSLIPKLWIEVLDHSDLPGHNPSHVVPTLGPRRRYQWETHTLCTRRGEYQLGPMTVVSGDPFGLFQFPRQIAAVSSIIVYPPTVPIHRFATPAGTLSGGEAVRRRAHFVTTNASGVRDYQPGDSYNRIHWRSSARKDRLLVKEFELDPLSDVWLFLDLSHGSLVERAPGTGNGSFATMPPPSLPPSTEEYGVTVAASLARYFVDKGRALGFATYAPRREIVQPDRGPRLLTRILEILAVAHSSSDITLQQMLALEANYLARGTTAVVVTASVDPRWVTEAYTLSRRGIQVSCVLIDPRSFGSTVDTAPLQNMLEAAGIQVHTVHQDDDLTAALSYRVTGVRARAML
ncbi:MAG TPA: DUF58 domain-containing protein [Aggregatilinea sp.]|uniref:DUF58 domain-containing protein n=1 Tax=Aggregatilinea sp. TaxID=2806333 RepID=UPI002BE83B90|nr:DUF58 domain-containing protein [Aggregatilinea sp.]HML24740.1 DUF58 domain-containing protein [Aggregatilinea sp.]